MCFLYRQSISIVYESKFKYIYRYFIKIDRCFCGILLSLPLWKCGLKLLSLTKNGRSMQSLPLWKCGLKYAKGNHYNQSLLVTSLVEVWIEIKYPHCINPINLSLPLWKCGLKLSYHLNRL